MSAPSPTSRLVVTGEVSDAIASGRGVVALESTIISHGLPTATSAATARRIEAAVRAGGAVPATVAVLDGAVRVGLSDDQLVRIAEEPDVVKTSVRDLGPALVRRLSGATTVAATAYVAHRAGIRVFATGGLGGVHRGARHTWDESADLLAVAAAPVTVVCAGVKSLLDVPATLERLETLSVPVLGYGHRHDARLLRPRPRAAGPLAGRLPGRGRGGHDGTRGAGAAPGPGGGAAGRRGGRDGP
jgi:pseudouridine-5'-phosphate glycosidase